MSSVENVKVEPVGANGEETDLKEESKDDVSENVNGDINGGTSEVENEVKEENPETENSIKEEKNEESESAVTTDGNLPTSQGKFKVKINNLPRYYPLSEFKRMCKEELGLALSYIRSPRKGNPWLHLIFFNEEEQKKAVKVLHKYVWKKRTLSCTIVTADAQKRKYDDTGDGSESKRAKLDLSVDERVLASNIPYHDMPYEDQLKKKSEEIRTNVKRLGELIARRNLSLVGWVEEQIAKNDDLPFKLEEIKPSPVLEGYRNKCEFRIGLNPDTKERTVGCRVENYKDGTIGVGPASSLKHLPERMREIVKLFEEYIRKSEYGPFLAESGEGHWRHLVVRMTSNGETMVTVVIHPQSLTEEELAKLKEGVKDFFTNGEGKSCEVTSLYFQLFTEKLVGQPLPEVEHLHGKTQLEEKLFDLTFHLSPSAYFHVNTKGAEVLYQAIMDLVEPTEDTVVMDLCCGIGGIGLCIAKKCGQVYGIEYLASNVEDAKKNAEANGITNCEFSAGKVEDILPTLVEKVKGKNVVPILDPPRTGLSQKVLSQLRKMEEVKKIIYVYSNHKAPIRNFLDLSCNAGRNGMSGNPFIPVKAIPVDIAPHSMHCHMIVLLERVDVSTLPKSKNPFTFLTRKGSGKSRKGGRNQGNAQKNRDGRPQRDRRNRSFSRGRDRDGGFMSDIVGRSLLGSPSPYRRGMMLDDYRADFYMSRDYLPPVVDPYMRRRQFASDEAVFNRYSNFRREMEDRMYRSRGSFGMRDNFYMDSPYAAALLEREEMAFRAQLSRGLDDYGSFSSGRRSNFDRPNKSRRGRGGGGGGGYRRGRDGRDRKGFGKKK